MAEYPYLPFWTDAYIGDCNHLSDAEHGRYLLILMTLWRAPDQRIPNDVDWLARRFRRPPEQVQSEIIPVLREFCKTDGNWWWQERLCKEHDWVKKKSAQRSVAAKSRWEKEKVPSKSNAGPHSSRNAPTPTPKPKDLSTTVDKYPDADFDAFWAIYPLRVGKGQARKAWATALKKTTPAEIMTGLSRYKRPDDPKFIPHPASWLNGERWNDEPEPLSKRDAIMATLDRISGGHGAPHPVVVPGPDANAGMDGRGHQGFVRLPAGPAEPAPVNGHGRQPQTSPADTPTQGMGGQRAADPERARSILALAGRTLQTGR